MAALGGEKSTSVGLGKLLERMEREEFDLIAVGWALISNPDWANKIRSGDGAELQGFDALALAELV